MAGKLAWLAITPFLKGMHERLREHPVRVYVMGTNEWHGLENWPPATRDKNYFLHAQGRLTEVAPQDELPDSYWYDPANPTPAIGGAQLDPKNAGSVDNLTLEGRDDVLCYTTEPLESNLTVMGTIRVQLSVQSTSPYVDFFGRVCDVSLQGQSFNVTDGILRLEPGSSEMQSDGSVHIELALWPTAYCFQADHRLRLLIASGAHPRWARNLGTGEPIATATKMVKTQLTLYHDNQHSSMVIFPVNTSL